MRPALLLPLLLLASPGALGDEVLFARDEAHLSVLRGALTEPDDADAVVTARAIVAKFGARWAEDGGPLSSRLELRPGAVAEVQDLQGRLHRVRVSPQPDGTLRLPLLGGSASAPGALEPGTFTSARVLLNAAPTSGDFGRLLLLPDGRYQLGQARGRWRLVDSRLALDGAFAHWGLGTVTPGGTGLSFSFLRGALWWQVHYVRSDGAR